MVEAARHVTYSFPCEIRERGTVTLNWDFIIHACKAFRDAFKKKNLDFDAILPVSRSGLIMASFISSFLDGIRILFHLPRAGDTRKFLVIDGVCDTGFTFDNFVKDLRTRDINFTTACVVLKEDSIYEPNFHAMVLNGHQWVKILGERFLNNIMD